MVRLWRRAGQSQHQLAELDEIFLLEVCHRTWLGGFKLDNVEDGGCRQSDTVLVRDDNLGHVQAPGCQFRMMDGPESVRQLADVAPQNVFRYGDRSQSSTTRMRLRGGEVVFIKGLRKRVIVMAEYEGTVLKDSGGEGLVECHHIGIDNLFPLASSVDSLLVGQAVAFQPAQTVVFAILAGNGLENPAGIAEDGCVLSVACVEWKQRVVLLQLR